MTASVSDLTMNPDLIPQPGVLFHLAPTGAPDEFWVNLDTRGAGHVIGRVMLRHDGTCRVYVGRTQELIGDTPDAESGMWVCIRAWMNGPDSPASGITATQEG